MKKIFLDTNFILDYFVREQEPGDCERLLRYGHARKYTFYISYLSVANFAYIMRKLPQEELYSKIMRICTVFQVVGNTKEQIMRNLTVRVPDFEDGLQYQSALEARCDIIITRNQKDFNFSSIPIMSPSEYLDAVSDAK